MTLHPKFITDKTGNKSAVILSIKEFDKLLEEMDELEDIQLYNEGKKDEGEYIPLDEAIKMIEAKRKKTR